MLDALSHARQHGLTKDHDIVTCIQAALDDQHLTIRYRPTKGDDS